MEQRPGKTIFVWVPDSFFNGIDLRNKTSCRKKGMRSVRKIYKILDVLLVHEVDLADKCYAINCWCQFRPGKVLSWGLLEKIKRKEKSR